MKRECSFTQLDNSSQRIKESKQSIELYEYGYSGYGYVSLVKINDTWWSGGGQELNDNDGKFIWEYATDDCKLMSVEHIPKYDLDGYVIEFLGQPIAIEAIEAHWGSKVVDKVLDALRSMIQIPDPDAWGISDNFLYDDNDATNDLWLLMSKCFFNLRFTKRWDIWVPDSAFVRCDPVDWLTGSGAVCTCRYIIEGGDRYTDLRNHLSKTRKSHRLVQDIFMGGEMRSVVCALWIMCYIIKVMPKDVFKRFILPNIIWTEVSFKEYCYNMTFF